jgi:predicted PurR-regulated permease PerM
VKPEENIPGDRRRVERMDAVPLADFTIPEVRKAFISTGLLLLIIGLFLYMVRDVIISAVAGVVLGAYLLPLYRRLLTKLKGPTLTAIITITLVTVPVVLLLAYSWSEISDAVEYLSKHRTEVAAGLTHGLQRWRFTAGLAVNADVPLWIEKATKSIAKGADDIREAGSEIGIGLSVLLFTAFYILTDHARLLAYIRSKIHGRYRELADETGTSIRNVIYGALYGTFLTQGIKSVVVLLMNLIWHVPLAVVLAIIAFFLGFFPIVGSYIVYAPVSIYLILWRGDLVGGIIMFLVGFLGNTMFMSMYMRPKLAADRSHVLNFYWMFIALVTGVYTFGLVGIIIGPVLIAVLKAVFETVSGSNRPGILDRLYLPDAPE